MPAFVLHRFVRRPRRVPARPAGTDGPTPTSPATEPEPGPLSGNWIGLASEDMGLVTTSRTRDDYCINRYDFRGALIQRGTTLCGILTSSFAGADCMSESQRLILPPETFPGTVTDDIKLLVTPSGGVTMSWEERPFHTNLSYPVNHDLTGTYTSKTLIVSGERAEGHNSWSIVFSLRRQ